MMKPKLGASRDETWEEEKKGREGERMGGNLEDEQLRLAHLQRHVLQELEKIQLEYDNTKNRENR